MKKPKPISMVEYHAIQHGPCPQCNAPQGQRCTAPKGIDAHEARIDAHIAAGRQKTQ